MTRSIREVLATLPSGKASQPLDDIELGEYLRSHYDTEAEKERNQRHAVRDVIYWDGGCEVMKDVINEVFQDPVVKELRKKWVPYARFSNDVKRIVNEMSTVYAEPAQRSVGGSPENQAAYRSLVDDLMLDEQLDYANRMANLHRAILVGPRIREDLDGNREMVLDVATPAAVRAVVHPQDTSKVVGWLIRVDTRQARRETERTRAWQLWTDHEVLDLDEKFVPVAPGIEHGLGVNRWVPLAFNASSLPGFWPGDEGEDLVAAAVSIWMAHVLLLKETKSATMQTVISGDVSAAARGQSLDSEVPTQFPEGVAASTIDMSMDTDLFTKAADHVLERVGNGYGLSLTTLKHQGTQSAEAREIILEPLRALRRKQIKFFRRFERRLVQVMAAVARKDAPALAFDPIDWRIDFGEIQALTPKKQRMEEFLQAQQIGIDNIVAFFMRENPDIADPDKARDFIRQNIMIRTWLVEEMQDFMRLSGAMGAGAPADQRPRMSGPEDNTEAAAALRDDSPTGGAMPGNHGDDALPVGLRESNG